MTNATPATIPTLAAILPRQVGYQFHDDLVIVGLDSGKLMKGCAVVNITRAQGEHVEVTVEAVAGLARQGSRIFVLMGYEDDHGSTRDLLAIAERTIMALGLTVAARAAVLDGQVYDLATPDAGPRAVAASGELPEALTERRATPAPHRDALRQLWQSVGTISEADRKPGTDIEQSWRAVLGTDDATDAQKAEAIHSAASVTVRDAIVMHLGGMAPDKSGPEFAALQGITGGLVTLERLRLLISATSSDVPSGIMNEVRVMAAAHAWHLGEIMACQILIEKILETDPNHRLAGLLATAIVNNVRPKRAE